MSLAFKDEAFSIRSFNNATVPPEFFASMAEYHAIYPPKAGRYARQEKCSERRQLFEGSKGFKRGLFHNLI